MKTSKYLMIQAYTDCEDVIVSFALVKINNDLKDILNYLKYQRDKNTMYNGATFHSLSLLFDNVQFFEDIDQEGCDNYENILNNGFFGIVELTQEQIEKEFIKVSNVEGGKIVLTNVDTIHFEASIQGEDVDSADINVDYLINKLNKIKC